MYGANHTIKFKTKPEIYISRYENFISYDTKSFVTIYDIYHILHISKLYNIICMIIILHSGFQTKMCVCLSTTPEILILYNKIKFCYITKATIKSHCLSNKACHESKSLYYVTKSMKTVLNIPNRTSGR